MKKMNKNLSILIIIAFLGLFSLWFFWFINKISPGEKRINYIIDVNPENKEINEPIDREIFIYFNNPVKLNKKNIKTSPPFEFKIESSNDKKVFIIKPLKFLEKNTNYEITITMKEIKNSPYKTSFQTGDFAESILKQDIVLLLKMKKKLPFYSSIFDLTYIEEKGEFAAIINIPNCKKAKKAVINYLKANGFNPEKVKISWYSAVNTDLSCVKIK